MNRKIIITILSPINNSSKIIEYVSDCKEIIKSAWTNGAGLIYFLKTVPDCTDIICLCSKETNNDEHKYKIIEIIEQCHSQEIKPQFIEYQTDNSLFDITNSLLTEFKFESSDTVYLDTTGGLRSVAYSLVYLFRYFEYKNIKIEKAIYSSIISSPQKIEDIKDTFRMFDLINGAHEFTTTGNPQTLMNFFEGNTNAKIKELLGRMNEFYDAISLCRLTNISSTVKKLNKGLNELMAEPITDFNEKLFVHLIPIIKEKLTSSGKFTYLSLIKWCLSNNLLQQAITIYVEKLPRAYFKELKFLQIDEDKVQKKSSNLGVDEYAEYFIAYMSEKNSDNFTDEMTRIIDDNQNFLLLLSPKRNFNQIFKDTDYSDECKKNFRLLVQLRDYFYDNKGDRVRFIQNNSDEKSILNQISVEFDQLPKKFTTLLDDCKLKNYSLFCSKCNKKPDDSKDSKSVLNNYYKAVNNFISNDVEVTIKQEQLKHLRLDYLYVKYIRNQINHASEKTEDEPKFKQLMSGNYGYDFPPDNNFSATKIRNFLIKSIAYIEDIKTEKENTK